MKCKYRCLRIDPNVNDVWSLYLVAAGVKKEEIDVKKEPVEGTESMKKEMV